MYGDRWEILKHITAVTYNFLLLDIMCFPRDRLECRGDSYCQLRILIIMYFKQLDRQIEQCRFVFLRWYGKDYFLFSFILLDNGSRLVSSCPVCDQTVVWSQTFSHWDHPHNPSSGTYTRQTANCTLLTIHCTSITVHFILHTTHCTLNTKQYTLHTSH